MMNLSQQAEDQIFEWKKNNIVDVKRINWHTLFFDIAGKTSERSLDSRTKLGAVIVRDNRILSTGYNSHIMEIETGILPNSGDDKHFSFMHAEINAILNCAREGISTKNAILYVGGQMCNQCLQFVWQSGIRTVYEGDYIPYMCQTEEYKIRREILLSLMGDRMTIHQYKDVIG